MELMPIADLLEQGNLGTKGKSLFINMMPSEAENAVLLRNRLSGSNINYELPGFFKTNFQVIARSHDYNTGKSLMDNVIAALTLEEQTVGGMYVKYMRPHTLPVSFPLSKGNFVEFNVMFDICFVELT